MIKETIGDKIADNIEEIVQVIINYFGEQYKEHIIERIKSIDFIVVRGKGTVVVEHDQRYVGDEPVCMKSEDKAYIFLPISLLGDEYGNITFLHELLHAISENSFIINEEDGLNETIIDYMANEMGKELEERGIDITFNDVPSYESNSLYSSLFPLIEKFYEDNKKAIIKNMMFKREYLDIKGVEELARKVQMGVDDLFCGNYEETQDIKKKR